MGLTRDEFLRTLPRVVAGQRWHDDGTRLTNVDQDRRIEISLIEQSPRALGALRLPSLLVDLRFVGFTSAQVEAFMARFERCFQRGGG